MEAPWTIRKFYLYLVCLITLIILIFAVVDVVKNVVEVAYPEPNNIAVPMIETSKDSPPQIDEAQMVQQQEIQRQWTIRRAVINLVRSVALLLVAGPLYIYHWRKIERS